MNIEQLREELEKWKELCDEDERRKSKAVLAKLEADDLHKEAEQRVNELLEKSDEIERCLSTKQSHHQLEIQNLQREKDELTRNLHELDEKIKECRKNFEKRRSELQVDNQLPHKDINYKKQESDLGNLPDISCTCQIVIQHPYILQCGQALLTFEEEAVATGIIERGRHHVKLNNGYEEVRASRVELGRTVTFEVNMTISSTKVLVNNLPTEIPEESLKDKLELAFYKSNIGGGEIESVECNKSKNLACITYKEPGVAQRVLKTSEYWLTAGGSLHEIGISPVMTEQLNKLQIFSLLCPRTALVAEIRNQRDSEDDIKDLIEIHFQKPSNGGGEVECGAFSLKSKLAHFEEDVA